jgi:hypothetical protein
MGFRNAVRTHIDLAVRMELPRFFFSSFRLTRQHRPLIVSFLAATVEALTVLREVMSVIT